MKNALLVLAGALLTILVLWVSPPRTENVEKGFFYFKSAYCGRYHMCPPCVNGVWGTRAPCTVLTNWRSYGKQIEVNT